MIPEDLDKMPMEEIRPTDLFATQDGRVYRAYLHIPVRGYLRLSEGYRVWRRMPTLEEALARYGGSVEEEP